MFYQLQKRATDLKEKKKMIPAPGIEPGPAG